MKRDHKWRAHTKQHVEIEPVARTALPGQPSPFLSQWIKKNRQEHAKAEEPKFDSDGSAGPEQSVLGRERTRLGTKPVIIEAVDGQGKNQSYGQKPSGHQTKTMAAVLVGCCRDHFCGCGSAHWFETFLSFSSVPTENSL